MTESGKIGGRIPLSCEDSEITETISEERSLVCEALPAVSSFTANSELPEKSTPPSLRLNSFFLDAGPGKDKTRAAAELKQFRAHATEARSQVEAHPNLFERLQGFHRLA